MSRPARYVCVPCRLCAGTALLMQTILCEPFVRERGVGWGGGLGGNEAKEGGHGSKPPITSFEAAGFHANAKKETEATSVHGSQARRVTPGSGASAHPSRDAVRNMSSSAKGRANERGPSLPSTTTACATSHAPRPTTTYALVDRLKVGPRSVVERNLKPERGHDDEREKRL